MFFNWSHSRALFSSPARLPGSDTCDGFSSRQGPRTRTLGGAFRKKSWLVFKTHKMGMSNASVASSDPSDIYCPGAGTTAVKEVTNCHNEQTSTWVRFCAGKVASDAIGFIIISLAATYIAVRNITYKGPRSVHTESQLFEPASYRTVLINKNFEQRKRALFQWISGRK